MLGPKIISLVALLSLSSVYTQNCDEGVSVCPPRFKRVGGSCYFIEGTKKYNWYKAAHLCRLLNSQLVSIEDEGELQSLNEHLLDNGFLDKDSFWSSGNDLAQESVYCWLSSGRHMNYTKWQPGEPNNLLHQKDDEDCVQLYMAYDKLLMNDWYCGKRETYFICETELY